MSIYEDILRQVGSEGIRSYLLLETFILRLLDHHLQKQNRTLSMDVWYRAGASQFQIDAVAPDGFEDLPGPTLIDLRYGRADFEAPGTGRHRRAVERIRSVAALMNARSVLVVYPWRLRKVLKDQISKEVTEWQIGSEVRIWDALELEELASRYEPFVSNVAADLSTSRLEAVLSRKRRDWRAERDTLLAEVRQAYEADELTLFLGAGVSIDAGLPDWNALLDALFVTLLTRKLDPSLDVRDDELSAIVQRLRDIDDASPLMAARYLRRGLAEGTVATLDTFLDLVTQLLYKLGDAASTSPSLLLTSLARLCMPQRSGPGVRAVVTYNFDDLLEKYLSQASVEHKSIYSEGVIAARDELPVFHVHGFLPEDRGSYDGLDKSTLVFSEEGYHDLFADPYHWSNLVQLNLLRESRVLMMGLSLTDPNLRRLLEIAGRRNGPGKHYALLRRMDSKSFTHKNGKKIVNARVATVTSFLDNHHVIHEELFAEFGVKVIWYENHSDVPALVDSIRNGSGVAKVESGAAR